MSINTISAQTVVCENSSCTANDYTLDTFYLGDENGVAFNAGYCDPGDVVDAHLWVNFIANSAAPRYTLYLHFNIYADGVYIGTVDQCFYEGQPIPTNVSLDVYQFSWDCGATITLENFYMSWRPNANQPCGCSNSKCYQESTITVEAPLIANFEFYPSCLSPFTLEFFAMASGGEPPYTFLWDFGDGNTSTLENPIHTYASTGPYTVTLTVFDSINSDFYQFEIVSFDPYLPPEIYPPPNLNIEGCGLADIPDLPYSDVLVSITEAEFNAAGGTLVLTSDIVTFTYIDSMSGTCPISIVRTFTVLDACNYTATEIQLIDINDTTLPTASNPATINAQCPADVPAPDINIITDASDNCSVPTVTYIGETTNGGSCPEILVRTYRVTDDCGNFIDLNQTIIINDDILPTASTPPPVSVQCVADIPIADPSIITDEADNCSIPVVALVSENYNSTACPITITRTYSVTDDCGNSISINHIITVDDTVAPTGDIPADITVQCYADVPPADIANITNVSDNCGAPLVSFLSETSNGASCPEVLTRTYSIVDDCGNETLLTRTITINDDIAPTASVPAPINVQCISDVPAPDPLVITDEADNCSVPAVTFVSDVTTGTCPQLITRTYRVEDDCGNYIDILQAINVNDDILPTASNPPPISLDCADSIPSPDISVVSDAADNCSNPVVAFVSDTSDNNCPETITRLYSVTDACGNSINVTQLLTFDDTEAPTLVGPLNDVTVNCDAIPPAPILTFTDNCTSTLSVSFTETDTNMNNTVDYVITRVWVVTDDCGNSNTYTQTVDVIITNCLVSACNSCGPLDDTTPPTASDPADIVVSCSSAIPPPDVNVVTDEADNCVPPVVEFVSETVVVTCFEQVTRVYSVTDECGNQILVSHTITVDDTTPPTASNPPDINVNCNAAIPPPDINVVSDAADNCSNPLVEFVSDVSDNACNERITRTYSVSDSCGNSILVTQLINVTDNELPTATAPSNINVDCIDEVPIPNPDIITDEADNCSIPQVQFISDISDNSSCPETITRTYRVIDDCGNFIDLTQLITISDTIFPTASNPAGLTVACSSDIPAPDPGVVTDESDNCSVPVVAFVSDSSDNLSCPETITRIYSVTDACGNSIQVSQTFLVDDTIAPTASDPATTSVSEASNVPAPDPAVVIDEADNCSIPTVTYIGEVSDNSSCPETLTRTYRVTDDCGNFIDVNHLIIIGDTTAPTASDPEPDTYSCETEVPAPDISIVTDAADNNSTPVVAFVSESNNNQSCPQIITRIYSVTDDCGNSIQVSHAIIIDDDVPPTASNPDDITVYDQNDVPAPDPEVVLDEADNCSIPSVAFVSEISNNDQCPQILTRTYSVTDDCGNSINVFQNIFVEDIEPPTGTAPADEVLYCIDPGSIPAPDINTILNVSDNVSVPTVIHVSDLSDEQSCPETITRKYRITDSCGNSIDLIQLFEIYNDQEAPTATEPADITVACLDDVPDADIGIITDAQDNCTSITVSLSSESIDTIDCSTFVLRTYAVEDECGNILELTHLITVEDTEAPQVVTAIEPEVSVFCGTVPEIPSLEITDNCDQDIDIQFDEDTIQIDDNNYDIIRTWTATDDCFNSTTQTQVIHMTDETVQVNTDLVLCIDEAPINLNDLITVDGSGTWTSDNPELLVDYIIDPAALPFGNYAFTYTVNENTCVRTQDIIININDDCIDYPCIRSFSDVTISKLVTPNNDGIHDKFEVHYETNPDANRDCEIRVDIMIFNRWGNKVYEAKDYQNDWSGAAPSGALGNSPTLPSGSYYYVVELRDSDMKPIQGYIYLGTEK
ncbi:MAG: gliding motility-associated C-terminal domain-containing protein [Bacteroidia bacterium]|nr:gliding motility-associated C-terminal domain-containing protein [Bacteroidia bacterium]